MNFSNKSNETFKLITKLFTLKWLCVVKNPPKNDVIDDRPKPKFIKSIYNKNNKSE